MNFLTFSDVFERAWTRSDVLGCVRMQSDAFRCVGMRPDSSGNFWIFKKLLDVLDDFWSFFDLGAKLGANFC